MRSKWLKFLGAAVLAAGLLVSAAFAEEAPVISAECTFKSDAHAYKPARLMDGDYATHWQSGERRNPYLIIRSETPMHGLYLCFRELPRSYEVQHRVDGEWERLFQGDIRYHHVYYELNGEQEIRIYSTQVKKHRLMFNEVCVLGAGDVPAWVQRWEEPEARADLLLLAAHPGDELLFFAGTIPTYDVEMGRRMVVAYLSEGDKTRRSEALNGLWSLGVRNYPEFGGFADKNSRSLNRAYQDVGSGSLTAGRKAVRQWVTALFRRYRPDVVLTQDVNGEDGQGMHMLAADACIQGYDLAADPAYDPDSAARYGVWEVKKLYLHRYGGDAEQLRFAWDVPLTGQGGKTGMEAAAAAFAHHATRKEETADVGGCSVPLSVEEVGGYYDNTAFGLYASRVGPDTAKNDFLENIAPAEELIHISDVQGLLRMAEAPDGSYVLDNDIDLAGVEWEPIRFSGMLDGNGYSIRNLRITSFGTSTAETVDGNGKRYETSVMGFFSVADHAAVRNICFEDAAVRGEWADHAYAAIVAGASDESVFTNVSVSGSVGLYCGGRMAGVGGIVGFGDGHIADSRAEVTLVYVDTSREVKCEQFMGGAVANGLMNCVNVTVQIDGYASIFGYAHCGGLIGMHRHYRADGDKREATQVSGNTINGMITFFECTSSRRAYCKPVIGEQLNKYVKVTNNGVGGFKRNEILTYDRTLLPEGWE